jgi:radical SAM protein with 4Fe4S-binding SPASM domain
MADKRPPCAGLWNTPIVHVNGDLTTCCLDTKLLNRLGNLREHTLGQLWNGETLHRWRVAQIRGDFAGSGPYCTACNWRSAGTYPEQKVVEYLEKTGELELLGALKAEKASEE